MADLTPHDIADQAIGLFLEYRDVHGYDEANARLAAALEVAEGTAVTDAELALGASEGTVTEWGVRFNAPPDRGNDVFQAYDTEDAARHEAVITPAVAGWSATVMSRQATPWTEAPEPEEDGDS